MPIYREDFNSLHPTPGFTRAKDSASSLSTSIAKQLNRITGGTDYQPGHFSWTPDQLDYVVGQLTGGAGREALKAVNYIVAVVKGENDTLPWHKVPMTGGYYGSTTDGGAENARFYENLRALNLHEVEIEGRAKNDAAVDDYIQENPESELIGLGSRAESRVTKLKKIRRQVLSTAEPGYKDEPRLSISRFSVI